MQLYTRPDYRRRPASYVKNPRRDEFPNSTGQFWNTQPLLDGRICAYAAAFTPQGRRAPDDEKAELLRLFGHWHRPIPDVLAAAKPGDVLRHNIHHQTEVLPAYHQDRTALLGHAAHAMTPTLGQGGNQAVEDA